MDSRKLIEIQNFSIISGLLFAVIFGSILLFIRQQISIQEELQDHISRDAVKDFVLLQRPQKKIFFNQTYYFYSYSGQFRNTFFSRVERVDPDYFHLSSPGKNVEAKIYLDPSGNFHSHLIGNTVPYGRDFSGPYILTMGLFSLGLLMLLPGILMRVLSGRFS